MGNQCLMGRKPPRHFRKPGNYWAGENIPLAASESDLTNTDFRKWQDEISAAKLFW